MIDEQINRAIHEQVMGLCWHEREVDPEGTGGFKVKMKCKKCSLSQYRSSCQNPPKYTTDLNAVALAEAKAIEKVGEKIFVKAVEESLGPVNQEKDNWEYFLVPYRATARQRSEAVLKCMEIEL